MSKAEDQTLFHADPEYRWRNFRGYRDTGWLTFCPLTILIGPNNSGKSSVLSPLLIAKQTIESSHVRATLLSKGPLTDCGNFSHFSHNHDINSTVTFGFRYHVHDPEEDLESLFHYPPGAVELEFDTQDEGASSRLYRYEAFDIYKRSLIVRKIQTDGSYTLEGLDLFGTYSDHQQRFVDAVRTARPDQFLFTPDQILNARFLDDAKTRASDGGAMSESKATDPGDGDNTDVNDQQSREIQVPKEIMDYVYVTSYTRLEMRELARHLSYLGPLRERATRFFEISGEAPLDVGFRGENAPSMLFHRSDALSGDVNKWAQRFELADKLVCEKLSDDVFQINLENKRGFKINIVDAGFGASQVLPIMIQCTHAKKGQTLIIKQPEIHLNPRLQCTLAELFAETVNRGVRLVVETHSEHLLTAIRRLITEEILPNKWVSLFFIERDIECERSAIKSIPIDTLGSMDADKLPTGFMQEALSQALAMSDARARRMRKEP